MEEPQTDYYDLYNTATGNYIYNVPNHFRAYFFGAALQFGTRFKPFRRSTRWWLEGTVGVGVKQKTVTLSGVPAGYTWINSIDLNIPDLERTPGSQPYFPGSLRILYFFGKKKS